jgi:hypothetical protein
VLNFDNIPNYPGDRETGQKDKKMKNQNFKMFVSWFDVIILKYDYNHNCQKMSVKIVNTSAVCFCWGSFSYYVGGVVQNMTGGVVQNMTVNDKLIIKYDR